jgi:chromosomal replication initiation ATPase DnaA
MPAWTDGRPRIVNQLIQTAACRHGILPREVLEHSRESARVHARRDVMQALRERGYSLNQIGRTLGGLHHSTVLHHLQGIPISVPALPFNPDQPDESGIWAI